MAQRQMTPFEKEVTECLTAIKNGDETQFDKLCHLTHAPLQTLAKRYLIDKSCAEDAVADVYLNIWLYAQSYKIGKNGYSYLWQIVKNNAYDYNQDHKKHHSVIIENIDIPDPHNQYDQIISDIDFELVEKHVGYTNAMILLWTYKYGYTQEQIGDMLLITKSAVNQRLKATLAKLAKYYKRS